MEKTALDDAFSPMLSKTMYFGDLEQINEKVSCNYMQPTKASLAAQKQRKDKLEQEIADDTRAIGTRRSLVSRNSPLKRPSTTANSLSTTMVSSVSSQ